MQEEQKELNEILAKRSKSGTSVDGKLIEEKTTLHSNLTPTSCLFSCIDPCFLFVLVVLIPASLLFYFVLTTVSCPLCLC